MKLYAMIEETGKPLAFHSGFHWGDPSFLQLNRFISMHALSFVHYSLIHLTNWVINGLPERFPKLKLVWVESGLAWVPFIMQRLDHEFMMRVCEAPMLKRPPSEYIREMYFTSQPLERTNMKLLEATFDAMKAETQLLFASDWPHWDFDPPSSITTIPFLSEQAKRNILGLNAARVFNLEVKRMRPRAQDVLAARPGSVVTWRTQRRRRSERSFAASPRRSSVRRSERSRSGLSSGSRRAASLQRVMTAAIKLYAAKAEAEEQFPAPVSAEKVTPTEIVLVVSELLRAADISLFDLAMWYRRGERV